MSVNKMGVSRFSPRIASSVSAVFFLILFHSYTTAHGFAGGNGTPHHPSFIQCLSSLLSNESSISSIVYTSLNASYDTVLQFPIENLRFLNPHTAKPIVIVTPRKESEVQAAVVCSKRYDLQIRPRSGGHDYEGLSTVGEKPFIVLDLINMRSIHIDKDTETAWIQGGATIGELYYTLAQNSSTLAFPAGVCPSVGVGGHIAGGGWGVLFRKHGLAADNVIDARLVDVDGRILDRKSMGEDLFWAIRGGGCANFGVIVAWRVQLVNVPPVLSSANINKTLDQNATILVQRWQTIAYNMPNDVFARVNIITDGSGSNRTLIFNFVFVYLGETAELMKLMQERFPELAVRRQDCTEFTYPQLIVRGAMDTGFPSNGSLDVLLTRAPPTRAFLKTKSDYVKQPLSVSALEGIWERMDGERTGQPSVFFTAYGGRMSEIGDSDTPFPHRAGNLYKVQYLVTWSEKGTAAFDRHMGWIRGLYAYMAAYASKNPRSAYMNYRDLDIGRNKYRGNTSYRIASVWGLKYFSRNFDRLVRVKSVVDPHNFFRNEQSIPVAPPPRKIGN